jgi:hypothetical protein
MSRKNNIATPGTPLQAVVQQFEHWRSTRKKRTRIPDTLWALVGPLMNQYNRNEIATALRINHNQLKNALSLLPPQSKQSVAFLECSTSITPSLPTNCVIEFTCKDGSTVKISGLQPTQIQPLISVFRGV